MKQNKWAAFVVAAVFGLSVSAMAQGRGGGHAAGGPPAGAGQGMGSGSPGGPAMGNSMGQMGQSQRGQMGQMGQSEPSQMRQSTQTRSSLGPRSASAMLKNNSKLSSNLGRVLGLSSTQLMSDASGFKNLGLFVASFHVSKNLNIPFDQLSAAVQKDGNLSKAIRSLQPNLSKRQVKSAVRTANRQSKKDMRNSKR